MSKGLKYAPTTKENKQELRKDIKEYTRRLKLAEFFHSEDGSDDIPEEKDLLRNKSKFNPKKGRNNTLDTVCETLQTLPLDSTNYCEKIKQNLSLSEEKALKSLAKDESIIIKEADKGGAVVIMNKDYYEAKIMNMLSDSEYYSELTENQDKKIMPKIKKNC